MDHVLQSVCVWVGLPCMRICPILQNRPMSIELSRMSTKYTSQFYGIGQPADRVSCHQYSAVDKIKGTILDHSSTFAVEGVRLHNMIICLVLYVPDEFVEQILNSNDTGQNMYEDYVTARINGHAILLAK